MTTSPPKLDLPQLDASAGQDFAGCMKSAADLVAAFTHQAAPATLDAVLAVAAGEADLAQALAAAKIATLQAETLQSEIDRFLDLADQR